MKEIKGTHNLKRRFIPGPALGKNTEEEEED